MIYAGLGDKDRTFAALDLASVSGPFRIGRALNYPEFALLKGDPRVSALRKKVGLPEWSEDDQKLAKALQTELKVPVTGLPVKVQELKPPRSEEQTDGDGGRVEPTGGGSDDIGDISWVVPTVTLRYPSNIAAGPGHSWANAISMATPIAHKGVIAGAKVQAMTMLDILVHPELVQNAWDYFRNVQTKETKYQSLLRPEDKPAIHRNDELMSRMRPRMEPYYYDSAKHGSYLEQLGVAYSPSK